MNELNSRPDDETRDMLAGSAERLLADLCTPALLRAVDAGSDPDDRRQAPVAGLGAAEPLWHAIADAGLHLATAPEAAGGVELGWRDVEPLVRLAGRFGAPVPLAEMLAAHALARLAGVELPEGIATLGVVQGKGATASGAIVAGGVAFAGAARTVLVSVPDGGSGAHRLLVLERAAAVLEPGLNVAGEERSRLSWERPEPVASGLLPAGVTVLLAGAAIRAAQLAGACEQVLGMSTRYANDRIQFGRPIGKFQAIQQQLALAGSWTGLAAIASQLALADRSVGLDPTRVASAKHVAASAAELCAGIAHAVHGAIGVTAEYDLQLHSRRLYGWAGEFGSALYWSRVLGEATLAGDAPRSWDGIIAATTV
jgi:acyl-CoA dehydrogenase